MGKLPTDVSGRELAAVLNRVGFEFQRQHGSHMVLRRETPHARVVVPDHKALRAGTLRQILREAGLSVEQFVRLLQD